MNATTTNNIHAIQLKHLNEMKFLEELLFVNKKVASLKKVNSARKVDREKQKEYYARWMRKNGERYNKILKIRRRHEKF